MMITCKGLVIQHSVTISRFFRDHCPLLAAIVLFDQNSLYSDRSANPMMMQNQQYGQPQQMMKSKFIIFFFQNYNYI